MTEDEYTPESDEEQAARERRERRFRQITADFGKEVAIFAVGVMIGFFWHSYAQEVLSEEPHIIIFLLITVLCLTRYIFFLLKWRNEE